MNVNYLRQELQTQFDLLHAAGKGVNPISFKEVANRMYWDRLERAETQGQPIDLDELMRHRVLALTTPRD